MVYDVTLEISSTVSNDVRVGTVIRGFRVVDPCRFLWGKSLCE
jgi:hypothetical protein